MRKGLIVSQNQSNLYKLHIDPTIYDVWKRGIDRYYRDGIFSKTQIVGLKLMFSTLDSGFGFIVYGKKTTK